MFDCYWWASVSKWVAWFSSQQLNTIALEATIWGEDKLHKVLFLGEVLLDLEQANTNNELVWYDLENHDENNGELCYPVRVHPHTFQVVRGFWSSNNEFLISFFVAYCIRVLTSVSVGIDKWANFVSQSWPQPQNEN